MMRFASLLAGALVALATPAGGAPALSLGSARLGNVFLATEAPVVTVAVVADDVPVRGRLRISARDAYGVSAGRVTMAVDLPAGAVASHALTLPADRLGLFQIQARLRGDGPAVTAQTTAAIVPPTDDAPANASAVGYYVVPLPGEWGRASEIAEQMRRLGIRWVRMNFDWWLDNRRLRPDPSDPAWLNSTDFELWTDAFRAHGIEVVGTLFGTARWASSMPDDLEPRASDIPTWGLAAPADLDDWELMVRTLVGRLRGRVRAWEVWNEPDLEIFWASSADEFAALVQRTNDAVRAVDPTAKLLISPVDRRTPYSLAFQDTVFSKVAGLLDVLGFHYGWDDWLEFAADMRPLLRPGAAVWNTEAFGAPRRHLSWWLWQRTHGVERIFPFIYHAPLDDRFWIESFSRFGLYPVNLDYTPREGALALRTLSDLVGSATPVGSADVGFGYRAYTFARPEGPVVALVDPGDELLTWSPEYRLRLKMPRGVRRITVVDLMGNPRTYRVRGRNLRLRLRGVAAFLLADPGRSLDGLRVVRRRAVRAR
jgi:hypothetical protein